MIMKMSLLLLKLVMVIFIGKKKQIKKKAKKKVKKKVKKIKNYKIKIKFA